MQGRSWMAALTPTANALTGLIIGLTGAVVGRADDAKPTSPPPPPATATPNAGKTPSAPVPAETSPSSKVYLALAIRGLGSKGCDVEIAPGHAGCHFRPVSFHLSQDAAREQRSILFEDIQTTGSDRYCIFAVTIREPGQPVQTVSRGLRLVAPNGERTAPQVVNCYLSSPSKLAKSSQARDRR